MNFRKIAAICIVLAGLAGNALAQQGQTSLTQTTLSSAVTGPAGYSGTSPTIQTTVFLASVTGIAAPLLPGTPVSVIYVDREAMGVFGVSTTLNSVNVIRGYLGTQASPHSSGQMVLIANLYQTTNATGANPLPSGLFQQDPPQGATCSAGVPTIPWVNVLTGAQWLCSSSTSTWVPGWNNPLAFTSPGLVSTTAASTGAQVVPGPYFALSGTNAITSFTIPVGMDATAVGYAQFCIYPTGAFTTTATNNIVNATTAVVGKLLCYTWNPTTAKFANTY
jgi:hypothetical protein